MIEEAVTMFHIGRSGSTVLGDLLNQHPRLCWEGEVYLPIFLAWEKQSAQADIDPIAYLKARMERNDSEWYGFEVKFFHLSKLRMPLLDYVAALPRLRVRRFILLQRRNYLRKIVSSMIAHQNSQFHRAARTRPSLTQIHLDVNKVQIDFDDKPLLHYLQDYEADFQQLQSRFDGRSTLRLTYEDDILPDPMIGYRRVCNFLGLTPQQPEIRYDRTNPFKLDEILLNFAQVERTLNGTPFAWMLYE